MHCPSCGQQQVSNETKFCSRCGMPLGLVSEVMMHGGFLPQLAELNKKQGVLTRRNGLKFSLIWCLFFLFIGAPFFGIVNADKMAGASAIFGIFGGMILMVITLLFLPKERPVNQFIQAPPLPGMYGMPQQNAALPPHQSVPASVYTTPQAGSWRDTNDLQPVSVSDAATKLLEKEDGLN
jgi:hypothetical protein